MPIPALIGTYPLPGMPGATITAGLQPARDQLAHIFRNGPVPLAEDIETYGLGLDALRVKCVTLATAEGAVVLDPRDPAQAGELLRAQDYASELIMHNGAFDCPNLALNTNCDQPLFVHRLVDKVVDTLIDARLAEPGDRVPKDLDACTHRYLKLEHSPIINLFRSLGYRTKRDGFLNLDIDAPAYLFGAASDGVATARLRPVDRQLQHPFGPVIGLTREEAEDMAGRRQEHNRWGIERAIAGLAADLDYLDRFRDQNSARMRGMRQYLAGLGITNGQHLVKFLDTIGALPPDWPRTDGGQLSAAAGHLQDLGHPLAVLWAGQLGPAGQVEIPGISQLEKLDGYLQKCVDMAGVDGRIHPTTAVLKAAHGRDSMADPPLHQFPGPARGIVLFDEDGTSTDYSQQEPRVGLNLAGDIGPPLLGYEQQGIKIYQGIADYADLRMTQAKVVYLAGTYGNGLAALSASLGLPPDPWLPETIGYGGKVWEARWGYQAAKDVQEAVFSAIPVFKRFMDSSKRIARDHQLAYTMAGRIVPIPSGWFRGKYSVQAHKWINYWCSGSANDEMSHVIVEGRRAGFGHLLWFGMHDELLHATRVSGEVKQLMETPSERFCRLAGRRPVIRTDSKRLGERWDVA